MNTFNFASITDAVADLAPDRVAVAASDGIAVTKYTYGVLEDRGNRLAHVLQDLGVGAGDRVAVLAHNRAEWLAIMVGCFKLGALFVNVNYRYTAPEIAYVLRDSESSVVIAEAEFEAALTQALGQAGTGARVLYLDQDAPTDTSLDVLMSEASSERDFPPRDSVDEYMLYTGGTTGMPKGVIWTQPDLVEGAIAYGWATGGIGATDPTTIAQQLTEEVPAVMAVAPLMHGNGQWAMLRAWVLAGTATVWTGRKYDPEKLLDAAEVLRVNVIALVGDAMAKPLADALERNPERWTLSKLNAIGTGGAVLSPSTRAELRKHLPHVTIIDSFGGSEIGAACTTTTTSPDDSAIPKLPITERVDILRDDLTQSAVGEEGFVGVCGPTANRYWNDPVKSAETFRVDASGKRWVLPGDKGIRNADGTFLLLGRGSLAINTGGEKVFPDEVETALKELPAVFDALVVGVRDVRYGNVVAAVVSLRPGATLTLDGLQEYLRRQLAGYKVPRDLVVVDEIRRSPAAKADYAWARELFTSRIVDKSSAS
ncbi:acyl-CoA synthetase (AMP-forming)/AMP-acid ligase II [Jatrophihabitans sp. GAS493]|uniref:AMP-binding protein n=1 Tax=Jatrophihabitans sp. GAS493 TaxID=1907575 RepID=UPI000BB83A33|nr:AMP-binding protein [Jatrophihabitans sp. GAS493]SOD74057.1 acyl-CoA synthetase (AMP-forming)/AMP-acid ligase II [Jatrophihabitans sp. GAS493]